VSRRAHVSPLPSAGLRAWRPLLRELAAVVAARTDAPPAGREARATLRALAPPPLERVAERFGLNDVEVATLALCAGTEWDGDVARACAQAHGDPARAWPTHGLACALFADGDASALAPDSRLRRWRLVDVAPGLGVAEARLSVDERILNVLVERSFLDPRLEGLVRPCTPGDQTPDEASRRIAAAWSLAARADDCVLADLGELSVDEAERVAGATCAALGLYLHRLDARDLPANAAEREALARLWEREALLVNGALLVECEEGDALSTARAAHFLDGVLGLLFTAGATPPLRRARLRCALPLAAASGLAQWQAALASFGPHDADTMAQLEPLAAQFPLSREAMRQVVAQVVEPGAIGLPARLWDACRERTRGALDALAQRIDAQVDWDDLVLPAAQAEMLRTMALHVRQRHRVYRDWGFDAKGGRGLGIAALFSGPSGTGKTLAAEVLASALQLDLYRIDLSAMVSKYVGETQKNLRHVFDAAEAGGAVLLFDEADALFGARSEVRDSLDRHANMEVAYLLQRVETYRGLAILTTNMKQSMDTAFLRRLRFIVHFPFPDAAARRRIWERVFPPGMPREDLDLDRLARLNLSGGHIRALALNAAFLAAGESQPVRMSHLLSAAEAEYARLEKPMPRNDVADW